MKMKRAADLSLLIAELKADVPDSSVEVEHDSKAIVYPDYSDDAISLDLTGEECRLFFHSTLTANQFYEAIGSPDEAALMLQNVKMNDDVLTTLERLFAAVDEI